MFIQVFTFSMLAMLASKCEAFDEPVPSGCQAITSKPYVQVKTYNLSTCIVLKMGAYFKTDKDEFINFEGGVVSPTESSCKESTLKINFECGHLKFVINPQVEAKNLTNIKEISGSYKLADNVPVVFSSFMTHLFNTTLPEHYYKCDAEQNVTMSKGGSLFLSKFAYEVNRNSSDIVFYKTPEECISYDGWPIFSLIIGLGIIIVVVMLIRYFIRKMKGSN